MKNRGGYHEKHVLLEKGMTTVTRKHQGGEGIKNGQIYEHVIYERSLIKKCFYNCYKVITKIGNAFQMAD